MLVTPPPLANTAASAFSLASRPLLAAACPDAQGTLRLSARPPRLEAAPVRVLEPRVGRRAGTWIAIALTTLVWVGLARALPRIGAHDIATLFYIAKSDDRNRVDYGIHLDQACQPVGSDPMFAYWRRFEPGQDPLGDLNFLDQTVYSVASQRVLTRAPGGTWLDVSLRALPSRPLRVLVQPSNGRCVGAAQLEIRGHEAVLDHVFVQLGSGPGQIEHVLLRGEDRRSGHAVTERVTQR